MNSYLVKWQITLDADSPKEAAEKALAIFRDEESEAVFFTVREEVEIYRIDLLDQD